MKRIYSILIVLVTVGQIQIAAGSTSPTKNYAKGTQDHVTTKAAKKPLRLVSSTLESEWKNLERQHTRIMRKLHRSDIQEQALREIETEWRRVRALVRKSQQINPTDLSALQKLEPELKQEEERLCRLIQKYSQNISTYSKGKRRVDEPDMLDEKAQEVYEQIENELEDAMEAIKEVWKQALKVIREVEERRSQNVSTLPRI